jgi:hypothetical protein
MKKFAKLAIVLVVFVAGFVVRSLTSLVGATDSMRTQRLEIVDEAGKTTARGG